MPTLEFAHKHIVERHHEQVPFRLLKPHPRKGVKAPAGAGGNMVIHGDNLEPLQALMPYYYGKDELGSVWDLLDPKRRYFKIVTRANLNPVMEELRERCRT